MKGYKACPICGDGTHSKRLPYGRKCYYGGHRKFLLADHRFRKQKKAFDGHEEHGQPPIPLTGEEILQKVGCIPKEWGNKKIKRGNESCKLEFFLACWKKESIFF